MVCQGKDRFNKCISSMTFHCESTTKYLNNESGTDYKFIFSLSSHIPGQYGCHIFAGFPLTKWNSPQWKLHQH